MSLTPAQDQIEAQRIKDKIELCGKNRGPHDYIPIEWKYLEPSEATGDMHLPKRKVVSRLLCRICFANVTVKTLIENYPDVSYSRSNDNVK